MKNLRVCENKKKMGGGRVGGGGGVGWMCPKK